VIWHFLEVWGLLLVAFAAGCLLGTLFYMALAASPLAEAQVAAADSIADGLGSLRRRVGGARESGGYRRPAEPETYAASAAYASPGPESYPVAQIDPDAGDLEPVREAIETIDGELEPLEAEWEENAYWEDGGEDNPAPDGVAPSSPLRLERPIPAAPSAILPPQEQVAQPELAAMRPLTLPGPRNGVPDNIQRIRGIGQKNEELLNSLGIYHFGQIAAWTPAEARWVASHLAFPERIERDDWIGQAIILATGGDTGYVKAADRRKAGEEPPPAVSPDHLGDG
jgi:predicted flap endonuclease-1-like 5' DNA nuclease